MQQGCIEIAILFLWVQSLIDIIVQLNIEHAVTGYWTWGQILAWNTLL